MTHPRPGRLFPLVLPFLFFTPCPSPARAGEPPVAGGRLRVEDVRLSRVWRALGLGRFLGELDGVARAELTYRHAGPGRFPTGEGQVRVESLRWRGRALASGLRADLRLTGQALHVENISGRFGDGVVRGEVVLNLEDFDRSRADLRLEHVPLSRVLFLISDRGPPVEIPVSARVRTTLGREVRGSAEVSAPHGSLLGLDFADVRIPLSWTIFPLQQRGRVWTPEVRGRLGHGEVTGAAEFAWFAGAGARLEGDFRFRNIDANPLLRVFSPAASGAGGKARGRLTLSGTDVRSVNDLRGTLGASFSRLQVFQLPVLDRVAALLGPVRSAAVTADEASLRASLSRGVVRVHEFSAVSPAVQVFIAGSVGLNGRLDLEVIAHTGRLVLNPAWLRLAGIQVPVAVGPIPVAVLIEVSNFLSRRTVQLEVTGTVDTPIVRVKAIPLLSEQAVRFFLNRASIPIP